MGSVLFFRIGLIRPTPKGAEAAVKDRLEAIEMWKNKKDGEGE